MKSSFIFLSLLFAITRLASASADGLTTARAEIAPLHAEMQAAANAHDTHRHLSFYVREPSLIFILNDQLIAGWTPCGRNNVSGGTMGKRTLFTLLWESPNTECQLPAL